MSGLEGPTAHAGVTLIVGVEQFALTASLMHWTGATREPRRSNGGVDARLHAAS